MNEAIVRIAARGDGVTSSGRHVPFGVPGDAVLDDGQEVKPDVARLQTVRLAMWIFGLPAALRSDGLGRFRQTMREADELLDWPGDPAPKKAQWRALAEIAGTALRQRISLQAASTRDIEWNGPAERV